jgi:hypothetical protein
MCKQPITAEHFAIADWNKANGTNAMERFPGHLVCGFVDISGRDEPRVLLLPAATAAKLDLEYVHDHDASVLHVVSVAM